MPTIFVLFEKEEKEKVQKEQEAIERLKEMGFTEQKEITILGEVIGKKIGRNKTQITKAMQAARAACRQLPELGMYEGYVNAEVAELLFNAKVGSILTTALKFTQLTKGEQRSVNSIKNNVARSLLQLPRDASGHATRAELGWHAMMVEVWKAKLCMFDRHRRGPEIVRTSLETWMRLVNEGCKQGWLYEVREKLKEMNMMSEWKMDTNTPQETYKSRVKEKLKELDKQDWEEWRQTDGSRVPASRKERWGREEYTMDGTGGRAAWAAMRLGKTCLEEGRQEKERKICRLCKKEKESRRHVLTYCKLTRTKVAEAKKEAEREGLEWEGWSGDKGWVMQVLGLGSQQEDWSKIGRKLVHEVEEVMRKETKSSLTQPGWGEDTIWGGWKEGEEEALQEILRWAQE